VPSLGQLLDAECDTDAQGSASDSIALTLPLHLLVVAAVKTVVNAAVVFDVDHNFTPALDEAAPVPQQSSVMISGVAPRHDDATHAASHVSCQGNVSSASTISRPLPPLIKPSVSLLLTRYLVPKSDVPPVLFLPSPLSLTRSL
jgi:hypothetical protein